MSPQKIIPNTESLKSKSALISAQGYFQFLITRPFPAKFERADYLVKFETELNITYFTGNFVKQRADYLVKFETELYIIYLNCNFVNQVSPFDFKFNY